MQLSRKQNEYILNMMHRWNIKSGAVRSGKSFVDTAYVIPARIRERKEKAGLAVILGVSRDTIERNVLQPMREIYTEKLVGTINSRNIASVCGEEVYCLGAEKISQVAKIQGASIKYCYGDEIAKWNKEVFQILKSRLDKPYSCFDGACNPEHPTHWLKAFLDSPDIDLYLQHYTLFDNPHLDGQFVEQLCKEYEGTVYYDRLIKGLWKRAEGAIYKKFADDPERFKCDIASRIDPKAGRKQFRKDDIVSIEIGLDFGGSQSGHSFVARGYTDNYREAVALMSRRIMAEDETEDIDSNKLDQLFLEFVKDVIIKYSVYEAHGDYINYSNVESVFYDNAETVLGNSIRNAVEKKYPWISVRAARKETIVDRIRCTVRLMGAGRFYITDDCQSLSEALQDAVWNKDVTGKDERLDDGSSDIDSLDAFEYTIERDMKYLIQEDWDV